MSDRDTARTIIEEVGTLLAADTDLQTLVQNEGETGMPVRFYNVWAPQDCEFPYMTCSLTMRQNVEDAFQQGDLRVDVWDEGPSQERLFAMRARVVILLNRRIIEVRELKARSWFEGDYDLSQPEVEVWRRSLGFTLRLYPTAEVAGMKAR